jgi:hypothetical protein
VPQVGGRQVSCAGVLIGGENGFILRVQSPGRHGPATVVSVSLFYQASRFEFEQLRFRLLVVLFSFYRKAKADCAENLSTAAPTARSGSQFLEVHPSSEVNLRAIRKPLHGASTRLSCAPDLNHLNDSNNGGIDCLTCRSGAVELLDPAVLAKQNAHVHQHETDGVSKFLSCSPLPSTTSTDKSDVLLSNSIRTSDVTVTAKRCW